MLSTQQKETIMAAQHSHCLVVFFFFDNFLVLVFLSFEVLVLSEREDLELVVDEPSSVLPEREDLVELVADETLSLLRVDFVSTASKTDTFSFGTDDTAVSSSTSSIRRLLCFTP